MRGWVALTVSGCLLAPCAVLAAEGSARETYDQLNSLRPNPSAVYQLKDENRVELRRSDVVLSFEEGKFAFFTSFEGRITGGVFTGRGHVLATPRDSVEKQQMALFLGTPVLDQDFVSAILRFTDNTADELLREFQRVKLSPQSDADFAARWDPFLAQVNPSHSLRILFASMSSNPRPYFYAGIEGVASGPFDFLFDLQRAEPVVLGQVHKSGGRTFYDVWASYKVPDAVPPPVPFHALEYILDTSILPDNSLDANATVRVRADVSGERVMQCQLSRSLLIDSVSDEQGRGLIYFQNEGMTLQERSVRGSDYLYVILPEPSQLGRVYTLHFHYRGKVIEDAGNGVLFVGARESWYPHFGDDSDFAPYELTMRWPRHLKLVATGTKIDEHEDGDFRVGHWRTSKPAAVAGFNLGEYASASVVSEDHSIDVYANRQLEQALTSRLTRLPPDVLVPAVPIGVPSLAGRMDVQPPPPSPADALKQLAKEINSSIHFYETFSGPFPFQTLSVSQIPGTFGQGWPGLLYLSTFSFLTPQAQREAGLSASGQEHFTELVPYHEVAHQWWGNVVAWSSYRDQWIDEAIANYLALLFADSRKPSDHLLRLWLGRFRKQLLTKPPGADLPPAEIGALVLGTRLNSSKEPDGYDQVIYTKGAWVIHMLREMLRQPGSKDPDARLVALLHTLISKYGGRALSTEDLQREVEAVMSPSMDLEGGRSMDWFFEQWVRGTGIPHYQLEYSVHRAEKGYLVRGKLYQSGVPDSFISNVPLYGATSMGHNFPLGIVSAAGPETSFHFLTATLPHKLVIDPQMTLLCSTE